MESKDWNDYKLLHGGVEGARVAFEKDCATLIVKKYPDKSIKTIRCNPGDNGIDIFIGEYGQEPLIVY